jgi:hypothetical protein
MAIRIVGHISFELDISGDEAVTVKKWLDRKIRDNTGSNGAAILRNEVNIGFGTK